MRKILCICILTIMCVNLSGCTSSQSTSNSTSTFISTPLSSAVFDESSSNNFLEGHSANEEQELESSKNSYESMLEESAISNILEEKSTKIEESKTESSKEFSISSNSIQYDSLQKVFLELNFNTTENDIEKIIQTYDLEFTKKDYNGSPRTTKYKLAYESNVALQKYADSGDYIEITFNTNDKSFMYAEYTQKSSFATALLYNYGIHWNFSFKEPKNRYSGYYFYKSGDSQKNGIVLEYSNGNSVKTQYYPCDSAEDALKKVIW